MVLCSLFASLTAICAWISVPVPPVVFTMQTFAVLLSLGILGGKWGTVSILIYLLLGAVGLPVFAGFQGSAALLGPTGGFLWGFLAAGLVFRMLERYGKPTAMVAAQIVCYVCGAAWFALYAGNAGFGAAVLTCILPYLIPDVLKLALAYVLADRIGKRYRL